MSPVLVAGAYCLVIFWVLSSGYSSSCSEYELAGRVAALGCCTGVSSYGEYELAERAAALGCC
jgi:hypothetical protein